MDAARDAAREAQETRILGLESASREAQLLNRAFRQEPELEDASLAAQETHLLNLAFRQEPEPERERGSSGSPSTPIQTRQDVVSQITPESQKKFIDTCERHASIKLDAEQMAKVYSLISDDERRDIGIPTSTHWKRMSPADRAKSTITTNKKFNFFTTGGGIKTTPILLLENKERRLIFIVDQEQVVKIGSKTGLKNVATPLTDAEIKYIRSHRKSKTPSKIRDMKMLSELIPNNRLIIESMLCDVQGYRGGGAKSYTPSPSRTVPRKLSYNPSPRKLKQTLRSELEKMESQQSPVAPRGQSPVEPRRQRRPVAPRRQRPVTSRGQSPVAPAAGRIIIDHSIPRAKPARGKSPIDHSKPQGWR